MPALNQAAGENTTSTHARQCKTERSRSQGLGQEQTARILGESCHFQAQEVEEAFRDAQHLGKSFERSRTGNVNGPHFISLHLDSAQASPALSFNPRHLKWVILEFLLRMGKLTFSGLVTNAQYFRANRNTLVRQKAVGSGGDTPGKGGSAEYDRM